MALSYHEFRDTNDGINNEPDVFTHNNTVTAHRRAVLGDLISLTFSSTHEADGMQRRSGALFLPSRHEESSIACATELAQRRMVIP
jgi:hypothetical protein